MSNFCYVYILESVGHPGHFYVGCTDDLRARLKKHNAGAVPHTSKFRPWRIKTAIAFTDRERAAAFEAYLKTAAPKRSVGGPSRLFHEQLLPPCDAIGGGAT